MRERGSIGTLNDLFGALFKPSEGEEPVIRQPRRPLREELFALFFPEALTAQYADKSKSNLTWFFNNDARNKSVRRSLEALLREDAPAVVANTHRRCREALWPVPGQPVFDRAALRQVLGRVSVPAPLDSRWHITAPREDRPSRLDAFFDADEAAALARMLLTLAVAEDAPAEAMDALWRDDGEAEIGFMRGDESAAGVIRYCRMLDLQGRHERALEGFRRVARQLGRPAQTVDESLLYCRLGEMLFEGVGCARDERAAQEYDRLGCLDANPRSWFQLAQHTAGAPARQAMEKAVELGYAPAIRQLGMAWYGGSARLACVRNPEQARRCFQRGLSIPGADGAYCAFMLGQLYEAQNERDAAVNAYRIAREGGSAEAADRLARLDWTPARREDDAGKDASPGFARAGRGYCLTNGLTGCNRLFLEGLTGRWDVTVCALLGAEAPGGMRLTADAPEAALRKLAAGVYWGGAPEFPELAIALLSEDRRRNLYQAAALLGELYRLAQSLGERAWDLVDSVRLYVLASRDDAAPLLDAAFAGMDRLYFRVRVCDPVLDAAEQLFAAAPLFLPRLRAPADAPVRLKLLGSGETAMAVLRTALTLPLPEGAERSVEVYGEDAEAMGRRFRQLCPGLGAATEALAGPAPRFRDCRLEEALLEALDAPEGLAAGDYYVVATGDDGLNLRLAALLRSELMKRDLERERQPFIAVHAADPMAHWLAGALPAGSEAGYSGWYGQCELFPFGALSMYAPRQLEADLLERRARQAHMLFIGLPNTRDARHAAMASYYHRQLNRAVARAEAQALIYRMHLAGIDLGGWRLYGMPEEENRLGEAYTLWLRDGERLREAVRDEHLRRCRVLLALGWTPATPEQVTTYVRRGNPGHVLAPARLDPFICPWEALEEGDLLKRVREAVRARYPERTVPDPRRAAEQSVQDTERILGGD